ncbi:MAG: META domain-containing protein [Chitinophagaceae bacterium]|nr:META domain-containing protein [Chitinophagaceae bacterium]
MNVNIYFHATKTNLNEKNDSFSCMCSNAFFCSRKTSSSSSSYSNEIEGLNAEWKYSYASDKNSPKVAYKDLPTLNFNQSKNTVSGYGSCNELNADYTIANDQLSFSNMEVTTEKCDNVAIEKFVINFLKNVGYYKLESNKLFLYSKSNRSKFIVYAKG